MTNVININQKRKPHRTEDYQLCKWFEFGPEVLFMDVMSQVRDIEQAISAFYTDDVSVLEVHELLHMVRFIFAGICLPRVGVKVDVWYKKESEDSSDWLVTVNRIDQGNLATMKRDFQLQLYFEKSDEDFRLEEQATYLDDLVIPDDGKSLFRRYMGGTLLRRVAELARINGGECSIHSQEDREPIVLTRLQVLPRKTLNIMFECNFQHHPHRNKY